MKDDNGRQARKQGKREKEGELGALAKVNS